MKFFWCTACADKFVGAEPVCPSGHRDEVGSYDAHVIETFAADIQRRTDEYLQKKLKEHVTQIQEIMRRQNNEEIDLAQRRII